MNACPTPDEDSPTSNARPVRERRRKSAQATPAYASLTSAVPPDQVARALVLSARTDVIAAGIHARLDRGERGPHLVALKRREATDAHVINRIRQVLNGWFADHPRSAAAYLGTNDDQRSTDAGLAALGARRVDAELSNPQGVRIPVDTAAGAALLAARLTDGIPQDSLGTELLAIGTKRPIPTQVLTLGSEPRILTACAEQLLDLHHERRAQAAGMLPEVGINQRIHQQPTLAAWARWGRALTLDEIDHRMMSRTTALFLAAADGARKGKLSARWNAIIHPQLPAGDQAGTLHVASSGTQWEHDDAPEQRPQPLAPLIDQVLGSLDTRNERRNAARNRDFHPPYRRMDADGDDGSANAGTPARP